MQLPNYRKMFFRNFEVAKVSCNKVSTENHFYSLVFIDFNIIITEQYLGVFPRVMGNVKCDI